MPYEVILYRPDAHILYNPITAKRKGVRGSLMARIRLAQALANLGQRVTLLNCAPREARYCGALSLQPALDLKVNARLREIYALVYTSQPFKGLNVSLEVLKRFRQQSWLLMAEGYDCIECGFYSRDGR